MDRRPAFTPSRKVRKGRKERRRPPLGASLRLGVLASAVLVLPDIPVRGPNYVALRSRGWLTRKTSFSRHEGIATKCKNSGNEARRSLKTKEVIVKTNLKQTSFEPQTSVLNAQIELPWHAPAPAAGLRHQHTPRRRGDPAQGAPRNAENYKNSGNEAKK